MGRLLATSTLRDFQVPFSYAALAAGSVRPSDNSWSMISTRDRSGVGMLPACRVISRSVLRRCMLAPMPGSPSWWQRCRGVASMGQGLLSGRGLVSALWRPVYCGVLLAHKSRQSSSGGCSCSLPWGPQSRPGVPEAVRAAVRRKLGVLWRRRRNRPLRGWWRPASPLVKANFKGFRRCES